MAVAAASSSLLSSSEAAPAELLGRLLLFPMLVLAAFGALVAVGRPRFLADFAAVAALVPLASATLPELDELLVAALSSLSAVPVVAVPRPCPKSPETHPSPALDLSFVSSVESM